MHRSLAIASSAEIIENNGDLIYAAHSICYHGDSAMPAFSFTEAPSVGGKAISRLSQVVSLV